MYCTACGNKIDKGDAYCENCGMQLSGETSVDKMLQIAAANRMNKKPINKKMLIISALVTCIVLAIVFIITNQPPKYNVEDYVVIEYMGVTTQLPITVISNPVESIEVISSEFEPLVEGVDSYWELWEN